MRSSILLLPLVVLGFACAGDKGASSPGEPRNETATIAAARAVLLRQQEAWNAGDIDGFMAGYWHSDDLVFTSGGRIRRGWQATRDAYHASYGRENMGHLTFSDLEFTPVGDSVMVVLGRWALAETARASGGVFTLVMRRFAEGWLVIHDHTSTDGD